MNVILERVTSLDWSLSFPRFIRRYQDEVTIHSAGEWIGRTLSKRLEAISKGSTQLTVGETADDTKQYELNDNLPDAAQGKTARGNHKSKQSTEDEHDATGSVAPSSPGGHGHTGHRANRSGSDFDEGTRLN